jgi:hypothetical protein
MVESILLTVNCGLQNNTTNSVSVDPAALIYPRQIKRGSSIVLEIGYMQEDLWAAFRASVSRKDNVYDVELKGVEGDINSNPLPRGLYTWSLNLGVFDSQTTYRVIINNAVGGLFDVQCTTGVYDSIAFPISYEYYIKTSNALFNADTLNGFEAWIADSTQDSLYTVIPLLRTGNGYWKSGFKSYVDSMFIHLIPLGALTSTSQISLFRLTIDDRVRTCILK